VLTESYTLSCWQLKWLVPRLYADAERLAHALGRPSRLTDWPVALSDPSQTVNVCRQRRLCNGCGRSGLQCERHLFVASQPFMRRGLHVPRLRSSGTADVQRSLFR